MERKIILNASIFARKGLPSNLNSTELWLWANDSDKYKDRLNSLDSEIEYTLKLWKDKQSARKHEVLMEEGSIYTDSKYSDISETLYALQALSKRIGRMIWDLKSAHKLLENNKTRPLE